MTPLGPNPPGLAANNFDGTRLRRAPVVRKTVDFSNSVITYLQNRPYQRDHRSFRALRPTPDAVKLMLPAWVYLNRPANIFCTKFVSTCVNKTKCPINDITWTPAGRRIITGNHMGQFTLWSGNKFNFETIVQAHDDPIRKFIWKWDDEILVSADHGGVVKYWQMTINNIKAFQAHEESVRDLDFGPLWDKFITASDDATLKLWDFARGVKEVSFEGHGWDVRSCAWHPFKALIMSGSKDSTARLWCPKSGEMLRAFRTHKDCVNTVKWHPSKENYFVTGSADQNIKIWDLRTYKEISTIRAHEKEVTCMNFHPVHHDILISGGGDGSVKYWQVGLEKCQAEIHGAHDSSLWAIAFHPLGHILATGSNDYTIRFWSRNKPGDAMDDKWNANSLPPKARELAMRSLAIAATTIKPQAGVLQDFDLEQFINEQGDDDPDFIPGMGDQKPNFPDTHRFSGRHPTFRRRRRLPQSKISIPRAPEKRPLLRLAAPPILNRPFIPLGGARGTVTERWSNSMKRGGIGHPPPPINRSTRGMRHLQPLRGRPQQHIRLIAPPHLPPQAGRVTTLLQPRGHQQGPGGWGPAYVRGNRGMPLRRGNPLAQPQRGRGVPLIRGLPIMRGRGRGLIKIMGARGRGSWQQNPQQLQRPPGQQLLQQQIPMRQPLGPPQRQHIKQENGQQPPRPLAQPQGPPQAQRPLMIQRPGGSMLQIPQGIPIPKPNQAGGPGTS